jgi:hypothetical protein
LEAAAWADSAAGRAQPGAVARSASHPSLPEDWPWHDAAAAGLFDALHAPPTAA